MPMKTQGATQSPVVAVCALVFGLFVLWVAQPVLPGWACAASSGSTCLSWALPVRASAIGAGILAVLLGTVLVGLILRPGANRWLGDISRSVLFAVPAILVATVIAHFLIPQP